MSCCVHTAWWFLAALLHVGAAGLDEEYADVLSTAQGLIDEGDGDSAVRFFEQAISLNPERPEAYMGLAFQECDAGSSLKRCAAAFRDGVRLLPESERSSRRALAGLTLGGAYALKGKTRKASKYYRSAIEAEPASDMAAQAWCQLGFLLSQVGLDGDVETSIRESRDAYAASLACPGFAELPEESQADCGFNLGNQAMMVGEASDLALAERGFRAALRAAPSVHRRQETLYHLASVKLWQGDMAGYDTIVAEGISIGFWERAGQHPKPPYLPGVKAVPWPDIALYSGVQRAIEILEAGAPEIRKEAHLLAIPEYRNPIVMGGGSWRVRTTSCTKGRAKTPRTCAVLDEVQARASAVLVAEFLRLQPGTVLRPHCGEGNHRWVVHLGLEVPENASITVAGETREWVSGRCTVFDDSFVHSARNEGGGARVVLAVQLPSPEHEKIKAAADEAHAEL